MNGSDLLLLICLLLPVAFACGWWVARKNGIHNSLQAASSINPDYFKGLNYVLNEQPDKAIEVFIKMLEVDSETVETHLALGNLFRRRGEVDRAIRIHQNLIARPNLSLEQRNLALLELGMDYMRSGLLDRAEGLFKQLITMDAYAKQACRQLLSIYQQEKDWDNAIICARRLEAMSGEGFDPVIAQYYCEIAADNLSEGKVKEAREKLRKALNMDPRCVRASILEAELLQTEGKHKSALKVYKRIEKQDVEYIAEVIEPILACYRKLEHMQEAMQYLQDLLYKHGGITPLLYLTELIIEHQGEEEGIKFISAELRKRPTVKGVDRLLEYAMSKSEGEIRDNLGTIKDLTGKLLDNTPVYKCKQCGFDAKLLHWQCPSCKNWNTIKPVYGVEGE
jgi:lipopolysaccharide assembly protein B